MNFEKIEIKPKMFYTVGCWCFGLGAIMQTWTLIVTAKNLIPSQILSQAFSCIFAFALFGFFYYLLGQIPPEIKPENVMKDREIEEYFNKKQIKEQKEQ